ncbi:MAG: M1 family metallopeptidase [Acidobacteriaceae bacterium]|nr:M1 family metallopeptidase [Acidobacteriaceae bacterium]
MRSCLPLALLVFACSPVFAQRLPGNALPEHYTLHLTPHLNSATFTGEETVALHLQSASSDVTLNAVDLQLTDISASAAKGSSEPGSVTYDTVKQQATLHFARPLPAGDVTLSLHFAGTLDNKLRGFYLSKTKTRSYAITQFEPTDARRAFPVFDEPAMKATFDLSLTVDTGDSVISNTNVLSDLPAAEGTHTVTFARTPRMSSYLLAFQVGDWACRDGEAEGVAIRVCSTPDKFAYTGYALKAAEHFLGYYNHYFGVKYPLPKLDLIGVPDFEAGAMENWGCITYRESSLLVDAKTAPASDLDNVALTVAHEMAHQWFGDLVTMKWWDNVWLNEGFATWMEYKAVAEWKPERAILEDRGFDLNRTMDVDATPSTRAIRARAETPGEITQQFDVISYGKAGAVLDMMEHYVGPEAFRKGVSAYIQKHEYANATAEDFWDQLAESSGKPADKVMSSYIDQPGMPLLTITSAGPGRVTLSQQRLIVGQQASPSDALWSIPVCFTGVPCQRFGKRSETIARPASINANADGLGFYRTQYSPDLLAEIIASAPSLKPTERINLLGDRLSLMRAGVANIGDLLDLVGALRDERDPQVFAQMLQVLQVVEGRVADPVQDQKVRQWSVRTFAPEYEKLGPLPAHPTEQQSLLHAVFFDLLTSAGDPNVLTEAKALAERSLDGDKSVDPELAEAAITATARRADADFYDKVFAVAESATDPTRKTAALYDLPYFSNPQLVARTLDYAVSGKVRSQDAWVMLVLQMQRTSTRHQAWAFIKGHWDQVMALSTMFSGPQIISSTSGFCSEADKQDVEQFFATHHVQAANQALPRAMHGIESCIQIRQQQNASLDLWLAKH